MYIFKFKIQSFCLSLVCILSMLLGQNTMSKTLRIFTGENKHAPYDFGIETPILGTVNPVLFGYLLKASDTQEISAGLIRKWSYDFKKLTYTLTLDEGKFHNGREITSFDLEFSIIRGFISKVENYNKIHYSDIAGIENLRPGMKFRSGMVPGIKVLDQKTIEISLSRINPIFLLNFTIPFAPLVPQEELKEDYFTWKTFPIGAGPYRVEKDYSDNILTLKAIQKVPDDVPEFIEYHTTRKIDQYDIIFDRVGASENEQGFTKVFSKYPSSINAIFFYRGYEINENINFRKAIYYSMDRDKIIAGSEQFKPAYEMSVRQARNTDELKNAFDLKLAKRFLNKVPKELLKKKFIIGVYSSDKGFSPVMRDRIDVVSKQLTELGLNIRFEPNPEKFPTPAVMKRYSMRIESKVIDLGDPIISYGALSSISPYKNQMPNSNGQYDKLYNEAVQAANFGKRLEAIQNLSKLIQKKALIIPLMQKYVMYRFNPATVVSLGEQSKPLFMDIALVRLR